MTTAPNAKCQRVLVLALCLVYWVFVSRQYSRVVSSAILCLSVCLSHIDIASKRLKLSSSTRHRMITQEKAIRFNTTSHNRAKVRVKSRRRHHGGGGGLFGAHPTLVLPCKQPSRIAFHGNALCPHTDLVRISIRYRFVTDTGEYRVLNAWVIHLLIKARNTSEHTTRWQQ